MNFSTMLENITTGNTGMETPAEAIAEAVETIEAAGEATITEAEYIMFLEDLVEAELGHDTNTLREAANEYTSALNEEIAASAPVAAPTKAPMVKTVVTPPTPKLNSDNKPNESQAPKPLKESQADIIARMI